MGNIRCHLALLAVVALVAVWMPAVEAACRFPIDWSGTWFQSGIGRTVHIDRHSISTKGRCIETFDSKYLIDDRQENLYRCMVISEKHPNVLQYKETFLDHKVSLATLCSHITGDDSLFSMFRVGAIPVPCPLAEPFQFTYYRGDNRECKVPQSSIDVCTEDWRLLLRFQACPDVIGSESTVEELVCLGEWVEGSLQYIVGKLEHRMATTSEDKYRCFVYEKKNDASSERTTFQLAQSGDATCNGLDTIEGSRTLKLTATAPPVAKCTFPSWMSHPHTWHTLDWHKTYTLEQNSSSIKVRNLSNSLEMKVLCHEVTSSADGRVNVVAHVTKGCKIGFVCMTFYQRSHHVIEYQMSNFASSRDEACTATFLDKPTVPFVTLITSSPKARHCPDLGRHGLLKDKKRNRRDNCEELSSLRVGCNRVDTLEFESDCPSRHFVESYECYANWEENGTSFLITSIKGTQTRYCFVYTASNNLLKFSGLQDSCQRNIHQGVGGIMHFNVTSHGQCSETTGSGSRSSWEHVVDTWVTWTLLLMVILSR